MRKSVKVVSAPIQESNQVRIPDVSQFIDTAVQTEFANTIMYPGKLVEDEPREYNHLTGVELLTCENDYSADPEFRGDVAVVHLVTETGRIPWEIRLGFHKGCVYIVADVPDSPETVSAKSCDNCGYTIADDQASYCSRCGHAL